MIIYDVITISSDELAKEIEDQKSKGVEVKEKLVQKEGEAAMLASINKQVTLPKVKYLHNFFFRELFFPHFSQIC